MWCATSIGCNCDALHCNRSPRKKARLLYRHAPEFLLSLLLNKKKRIEEKKNQHMSHLVSACKTVRQAKRKNTKHTPKTKIGGNRKARASRKNKKKKEENFSFSNPSRFALLLHVGETRSRCNVCASWLVVVSLHCSAQ